MGKKDYILIAAAIKAALAQKEGNANVTDVVLAISDTFEASNPLYDRNRFLHAALGWVPSDH